MNAFLEVYYGKKEKKTRKKLEKKIEHDRRTK